MSGRNDKRPFVEKAAADTREVLQSLFEENQRLATLVAELELSLRHRDSIEAMLKERVATVEEEGRRFAAKVVEIEQQNTNLANLYVASYQLNGTLDRDRVIEAIKEIVINLIGCEELAIWERDEETGAFELAGSFGIDEHAWRTVGGADSVIGAVLESGTRFIAGESEFTPTGREKRLTACIPLKLDDRVTGAIAIFELLQQKQGLEPVDFELFELLASHAASALYCTTLRERVA